MPRLPLTEEQRVEYNWRKGRERQARYRADPTNHLKDRARSVAAHARKKEWLHALKLSTGCVDCGYCAHPEALQFDHVRGEKKFDLAMHSARSQQSLEAEIAKCDVVCANCHAIRTATRRQGTS